MATWNMHNVYVPQPNQGTYGQPKDDEDTSWAFGYGGQPAPAPQQTYAPQTWGQGGASTPASQLATSQPPPAGGPVIGPGLTQEPNLLDPNAAYGQPLAGTTTGATALGQTGPAANETTTAGLQNQTRDALINILDQGMPTAADPTLAPQISAFNAAQNRATARQVNMNAEAFGAAGLESSGARLGADQGVIQQQGLNEASFASGLVGQELNTRREQIMDALKVAQATTDQDLSRRLQMELANIDAAIRERGLDVQSTLGQGDIDLRRMLGTGNLNLGLLGMLFQDRQFGDRMGLDIAQLESYYNNAAVQNMLAGS